MIRTLRYLLLAVLAIFLLTVALANRTAVELNALPPDLTAFMGVGLTLQLPLYVVIFAAIQLGVMIGFVWEWFREHKHRSTATQKSRQVTKLERELAVMRDTKPGAKDDVLALLEDRRAS